MQHTVVDPADDIEIELAPGDLLEVRLPVIGGTGYRWAVPTSEGVHLLGSGIGAPATVSTPATVPTPGGAPIPDTAPNPGAAPIPGAATAQVLTFAAAAPAAGVIDLLLCRSWESLVRRHIRVRYRIQQS